MALPAERSSRRPQKSTTVRFIAWARPALALLTRIAPSLAAALAERLFFTAPRARRSRGDALLRGAQRFTLRVEGRRVAAWRMGTGPTVALVHGWAGRAAQMTSFAAALRARGFSVVAFDAPGHGDSSRGMSSAVQMARALQAVASRVGPLHAVVAHSLGAAATALALRDGLEARRLVFVGPAADPPAWLPPFAALLGLTPEIQARLRVRSERRLNLRWEELNVVRLAAGLAQPLLVLHDRDDAEVPAEDGRAIATAWSGARFVETAGLGHNRIVRDPGVVETAVAFIEEGSATVCECGARASLAGACESCRIDQELFDRGSRWAALAAAV
jgi:pimeloyl-ACP methyl ester carboxylesterase